MVSFIIVLGKYIQIFFASNKNDKIVLEMLHDIKQRYHFHGH